MSDTSHAQPTPPPAQRHDDVQPEVDVLPRALIARVMLVTVMVGVALCFATHLLMNARLRQLRPSMKFPERSLPAPREIAQVREEIFRIPHPKPDLRAQQAAQLRGFSWVDRDRRLVRIPIEAAMDVVGGGGP